ncbi:MAG: TonB family protein [Acidobacteriaceae bacterium]
MLQHFVRQRGLSMIRLRVLASVSILAISTLCLGQDPGVMIGPYGVPRMVLDDTGTWEVPIKVFADAKEEVFIPDVTGPSWAAWHVHRFDAHGFTYFLDVYTYYFKNRRTAQELIYVDTRHPTYIISQSAVKRSRHYLTRGSPDARAIARITALVKDEATQQPNERADIRNYIQQDEQMSADEAAHVGLSPGVNPANAPVVQRYPRTAPQLLPGAIPGVNCGVGTNKSCCCANDSALPTEEGAQQAPAAQVLTMTPSDFGARFGWYVEIIKRTVAQNWYSQLADPTASMGRSVVVSFMVHRDGSISDAHISRSSGVPSLDLSAIQAVERARAIGPLPAGYAGDTAAVAYTFTYDGKTAP